MNVDRVFHINRVIKKVGEREYVYTYLRQSFREKGEVKKRTLANLSVLPEEIIIVIEAMLRGERPVMLASAGLEMSPSRQHGNVAAVVEVLKALEIDTLVYSRKEPWRQRALAMIVGRLLHPSSKCELLRWMQRTTLSELLGLKEDGPGDEREYYVAMDRLQQRQKSIERQLAKRHLADNEPALYDLSSSYLEGRTCPLAYLGYSRDQKPGKAQIVYGLITNSQGCPVAIEVLKGNTSDPESLPAAVKKFTAEFGLKHVIVVGDRGMIAQCRFEMLRKAELDWVTSMKSSQIRDLVRRELFQPDLLNDKEIVDLIDPEHPDERMTVCMNTQLREERRRKREDLLKAAEKKLDEIQHRTTNGTLAGQKNIALAVGKALSRCKVRKHLLLKIGRKKFSYKRDQARIDEEAQLDGIYVIRTSVKELKPDKSVAIYKSLKYVERAFRSLKSMQLHVRPVHHRREKRVRCHIFIAFLAYYAEWHLRQAWSEHLGKAGENADTLTDLFEELSMITEGTVKAPNGITFDLRSTPNAKQTELLEMASNCCPSPLPESVRTQEKKTRRRGKST